MSEHELTKYIPWVSTALLGIYVIYQFVKKDKSCDWVNKNVQKDQAKIATLVDIENLYIATFKFLPCFFFKTLRTEGFFALYRGFIPNFVRLCPWNIVVSFFIHINEIVTELVSSCKILQLPVAMLIKTGQGNIV